MSRWLSVTLIGDFFVNDAVQLAFSFRPSRTGVSLQAISCVIKGKFRLANALYENNIYFFHTLSFK